MRGNVLPEPSRRGPLAGSLRVGPVSPGEAIDLTLVLRRPVGSSAFPDVVRIGRIDPRQRRYPTREEFAALYGADPGDVRRVSSFVEQQGISVGGVSLGARTVHVSGAAGAIGRLFGVTFERWSHAEGEYRRCAESPTLPPELGEAVLAVVGLDSRPQSRAHFRRRANPSAADVCTLPSRSRPRTDTPPAPMGRARRSPSWSSAVGSRPPTLPHTSAGWDFPPLR